MTDCTTLDTALALHAAGLSVVPVTLDGQKMPAVTWKPYQQARADPDQIQQWFGDGHPAVGIICGAISGHLEMLELEGRAVEGGLLSRIAPIIEDHGLSDIWHAILGGYLEQTPSGGIHILYRVSGGEAAKNTKLARRPATPDELAAWKADQQAQIDAEPDEDVKTKRQTKLDQVTRGEQLPQVLLETRGEGGFVVVAPTTGAAHDTGRGWTMLAGGPATIATIDAEQRDALYAIANMLDEMPAPELEREPTPLTRPATPGAVSPGDDYNERATWEEILGPHGWKVFGRRGDVAHWIRPGKSHGTSATTGHGDRGDYFYVFSSSTELPSERGLSKFATYTHLEHGGNFTAAAKALKADGYGQTAPEPTRPALAVFAPSFDGTSPPQPDHQPALTVIEGDGMVTLARTDDGNALALVDDYGDVIRYCPERGRWLTWTGAQWGWCEPGSGTIREYAKQVARQLPELDKPDVAHKQRSLSAHGTTAMLTQAASDPRIVIDYSQLDNNPWELNTPGGIVDLRTGVLRTPDPDALHTRMALCAPDPTADPGRWHEFLTDTFGDDTTLIDYLRRLVGYTATGTVGRHILPFCYGLGGNGKGVFLEAILKVLGDYATTAPNGFLMTKAHAQHETEIARLSGARMVLCSEVNDDDHFDEARVKQLTGGDTLTARFMRQDHFTFEPTHKLWLMGNSKPAVKLGGHSFWRRARLIPFTLTVPEEKIIEDLQGILANDHGPALMAWIVSGAVQFAAGGLAEPDSVKAATSDYAHDQDTVARFVEDRCMVSGNASIRTKASDLRDAYERWCDDEGEIPVSAKKLGLDLVARWEGVERARDNGHRYYTGVYVIDGDASPGNGDASPASEGGWLR